MISVAQTDTGSPSTRDTHAGRHRPLDRRSGRQLASRLLSSPGSLNGSHPRQLHPLGQSLEGSARQEAAAAGAAGAAAGAAAAGIARECARGSPSSLAPALTSTSPSGRPSVCSSEDVPGAGCGLMPRSPPLLPLPLPPRLFRPSSMWMSEPRQSDPITRRLRARPFCVPD